MSTTNSNIFAAFAAKVVTFAAANSLPVAYPGIEFKPPTDGSWLEASWFPNETLNLSLANGDSSHYRGFGQISVCTRPGTGAGDVLALADAVIAAFAKGTVLDVVKVERTPWASTVLSGGDRVSVPVTIPYTGAA